MEYTTEHNGRGGFRFEINNPPPAGTKLILNHGGVVTFDEIGLAGMLACTDCNGSQQLYFPHQIQGPFAQAYPLGGADLTHL